MLVGFASTVVFFYSLDENKLLLLIQLSFAVEFISLIIRSLAKAPRVAWVICPAVFQL